MFPSRVNKIVLLEQRGPAVPEAYQHFKERLKNLHRIATPEEYLGG